ncbi:MAG: hypothetical protein ACI4ED_04835 [Suilimivivens sp.]
MYKKLILVLVTGVLMVQIIGCGNKSNQESTGNESAVGSSTADSDNSQVDLVDITENSDIQQGTEMDEEVVCEPADLSCELPNGFEPYEGEEGVYVYKTYPKDVSTISYVISESDEDITQMTQDEYKKLLEDDFLDAYGDDVKIIINSFENIKVDKRNGIKIKLEYEFKGVEYEQLNYIIYNGDETHSLNFTQEKGEKWMDDFEKCGDSLHFQPRE